VEVKYIRQVNVKEIDKAQFQEFIGELDLERAPGESIVRGPAMKLAMTQDEEVGESECDKSVEGEAEAVTKVIESSTIRKGKWKQGPRCTQRWMVR
jgi:hypothetical protein